MIIVLLIVVSKYVFPWYTSVYKKRLMSLKQDPHVNEKVLLYQAILGNFSSIKSMSDLEEKRLMRQNLWDRGKVKKGKLKNDALRTFMQIAPTSTKINFLIAYSRWVRKLKNYHNDVIGLCDKSHTRNDKYIVIEMCVRKFSIIPFKIS